MKQYLIEIKDEHDKDSSEPWSHYGAAFGKAELVKQLADLVEDLERYPITDVKIIIKQ